MSGYYSFEDLYLNHPLEFWTENRYSPRDFTHYSFEISSTHDMYSFMRASNYGMIFNPYNDEIRVSLLSHTSMNTIWKYERQEKMERFDERFKDYNLKFVVILYDMVKNVYIEKGMYTNIKEIYELYRKDVDKYGNVQLMSYMIFPTNLATFAFLSSKAIYDILVYTKQYDLLNFDKFSNLKLLYESDRSTYTIFDDSKNVPLYTYTVYGESSNKLKGISIEGYKFEEYKEHTFVESANDKNKEGKNKKGADRILKYMLLSQMFNNNK